jgi:hypothetical protein
MFSYIRGILEIYWTALNQSIGRRVTDFQRGANTRRIPNASDKGYTTNTCQMHPNIKIQKPLTRRANGPGLVIILSEDYVALEKCDPNKPLDPEPTQKWAEEGFAVAELRIRPPESFEERFAECIQRLRGLPECITPEKFGVMSKCFPSESLNLYS